MAIERLFIGEGVKEVEVKNYLTKELKRAGLAGIVIQRTPLVTRIVLYCDRPALVIGRKGRNVKHITQVIEQDYKVEKPELEIKKVEKPNLEPNIVAYRIASALERGMNSRRVGYKALQSIMRDGAKGAEIILSGKLVGKGGRARSLKMKAGYMKKCGKPSLEQVLHGNTIATCKAGTIGVEVNIVPQNVRFPDEVNILSPEDFKIEEEIVEVKVAAEGKPTEVKESKGAPKKEVKPPEKKEKKEVKPAEKKEAKKAEEKPAEKAEEKTEAKKEEKPAEKAEEKTEAKKEEKPKEEAKKPAKKAAPKKTAKKAAAKKKPAAKKATKK